MRVYTDAGQRFGDQLPLWNRLDSAESISSLQRAAHLLRETEHLLPVTLPDTSRPHLPELMLVCSNDAVDDVHPLPPPLPFEQTPGRVHDALFSLFRLEHGNLSGAMTTGEINRLMQRTNLTDDQAIALAVIRGNFDAIERLYPGQGGITNTALVRLDELWQRRVTGQGLALTAQETALTDGLQSSSRLYRGQLEGSNRSLFATANARDSVVPDACTQGYNIGNCHFVSAMTALAQTNPDAIVRMITNNDNGTYTVRFPGRQPIQVNSPTNAELAYYGTGNSHGLWSTILQSAYGRVWSSDAGIPAIEGAGTTIRSDGLRTLTGEGLTTTTRDV